MFNCNLNEQRSNRGGLLLLAVPTGFGTFVLFSECSTVHLECALIKDVLII